MRNLEALSRTPTTPCRHQTKQRTLQVLAVLEVKEGEVAQEEKAGVQPLGLSIPGPSSQASRPSITTCTGAPPRRKTRWASLGCSPRAPAARLHRRRCPTSRSSTWLCLERPRSSWARRRRRQCTRRRWRGCRSGRRGWKTGRKKGWCLLRHWRCWIALFSRGAMPMIKCSRGICAFFLAYVRLF